MKIHIKDKPAIRGEMQEQDRKLGIANSRPFPYNVTDFQIFTNITCYREIDTENLYFDEEGYIHYDNPTRCV